MKKAISFALAMSLILTLAACGGGDKPAESKAAENTQVAAVESAQPSGKAITVKCANVSADTHPLSGYIKTFQAAVDERVPGRIEWKNYFNSELGGERELGEMVHNGEIQGAVISCSVMNSVVPVPAGNLQDCMFMFNGTAQMYEVLDAGYRDYLDEQYEAGGLINMGYIHLSTQEVENNVRPIHTPEDMKGLKIRSYEGIGPIAFLQGVGAIPTTMAFSECYTALQQGTIDGLYTSCSSYGTSKLSEVGKYHTKMGATNTGYGFTFNREWFEGLDADIQEAFLEAAEMAEDWMRYEASVEQLEKDYALIEANGTEIIELTEEERALFVEAAREYCWPAIKESVGEELWAKALEWSGMTE